MKISTKAIVTSVLATIVIAGQAVAGGNSQPAPSWQSYHSTISKYPLYGYKKSTTTTTTTNTAIDASRRTTIDASRRALGSFNTTGSFNPTTEIVSASQKVKTSKNIRNGDVLGSSNTANLIGPKQTAYQSGSFSNSTGNGGGVSKSLGGFFNRSEDNRIASINVNQALRTGGDNGGIMENQSQVLVNFDGEQVVDGVNRSTVGNHFGNQQTLLTGDQSSSQQPNLVKNGNTSASASDSTTSSATSRSN